MQPSQIIPPQSPAISASRNDEQEQQFQIIWNGIGVAISFTPSWSAAYLKNFGKPLGYLTVTASVPLPISSTGHMRKFLCHTEVEEQGGPALYVRKWLDTKAALQSKINYQQLSLFQG